MTAETPDNAGDGEQGREGGIDPASLPEHTAVHQAERTAARVIDEQAVVIVIDTQKLHTLNEVGTTIWEHADGRTLGEIVEAIVGEYEVDRETALSDARTFIAQLADIGALRLEGRSG